MLLVLDKYSIGCDKKDNDQQMLFVSPDLKAVAWFQCAKTHTERSEGTWL